jgi:hypothetical protein
MDSPQYIVCDICGGDCFCFPNDELMADAHSGGEVYNDDYVRALTSLSLPRVPAQSLARPSTPPQSSKFLVYGSLLVAGKTEEHQEVFDGLLQ